MLTLAPANLGFKMKLCEFGEEALVYSLSDEGVRSRSVDANDRAFGSLDKLK
jgi:hypothetical protein